MFQVVVVVGGGGVVLGLVLIGGHNSLLSLHMLFPKVWGAFIHVVFLQRER